MTAKQITIVLGSSLLASTLTGCTDASSAGDQTSARGFTRVAAVQFEAPFLYQTGEELVGPEVHLMELAVEKLNRRLEQQGSRPNEILWVKREYSNLIQSVANQEAEFGAGMIMITEDRQGQVDFSDPYYSAELALVMNPSYKEVDPKRLSGLKIGIRSGSAVESWMREHNPEAEALPFSSLNEALLALRRAEIEAVADDRVMAAYSLATVTGLGHLEIVPGSLATLPVAVAVPKGNETLLAAINEAVGETRAEEFSRQVAELIGDRVTQVDKRYADRRERLRKAVEPRSLVLRISKDKANDFDIYRVANLAFRLEEDKTGMTQTTTRVSFRNRIGIASASLRPGTYTLYLPKLYGTTPLGTVTINPDDAARVSYNLRWNANSSISLLLAKG